jgi:hypothetical protein
MNPPPAPPSPKSRQNEQQNDSLNTTAPAGNPGGAYLTDSTLTTNDAITLTSKVAQQSVNAADCTVAPDRRRIRLNAVVSRTN